MRQLPIPKSLEPFVMSIFYMEDLDTQYHKKLPFYADGFTGVCYTKSEYPFYQQPRGKQLSDFYLCGQTIEPITLEVQGAYQLLCVRMYPFAVRVLLGVDPKILNDDCFDLKLVENVDTQPTLDKLNQAKDYLEMVEILPPYFDALLKNASINPDHRIKLAINLILNYNGTISIKEVRERLHVTERTLERHFLKEIGVTPKQFAKIIQFSSTVKTIKETDYLKLTEISYENGFADQSHFIRSFKRFTGKTPREFQKQISA